MFIGRLACASVLLFSTCAHSSQITFNFAGKIYSSAGVYSQGSEVSGSFSYDPETPWDSTQTNSNFVRYEMWSVSGPLVVRVGSDVFSFPLMDVRLAEARFPGNATFDSLSFTSWSGEINGEAMESVVSLELLARPGDPTLLTPELPSSFDVKNFTWTSSNGTQVAPMAYVNLGGSKTFEFRLDSIVVAEVPEPGAAPLLSVGLLAMFCVVGRGRRGSL